MPRTELQATHASQARTDKGKRSMDAYKVQQMNKVIADDIAGTAANVVIQVTPATVDTAAANKLVTRHVQVKLTDALGNVHSFYNGDISVVLSEVTAGNGVVTAVTTCTLVDGIGDVAVAKTGTWAIGDTSTVTVSAQAILGCTTVEKTSVETIVA